MNNQALAGVKVLDFGQAIAGPWSTRHLANHGAQVIHIETASRQRGTGQASQQDRTEKRPSLNWATIPNYLLNTSKYSIAINLKHPRAHEVMRKLIHWADIVLENMRPGTMSRLDLSYEDMCRIKPDIIMVSSSVYGQTGPLANEGGVDGVANAASGRTYLSGWPDRGAVTTGDAPYADAIHPLFTAMAMVAALDYRRRTGKGQYIDAAMIEVCAHSIIPAFLDLQVNNYLQTRNGNRIPYAAPHGVFPCIGDDRWCAIAVFTDEEWESFCHVISNTPWTKEPRFATLKSRKENENELEKLVADWTINHTAEEIMQMMQAAGVPAGIVQNAQDIIEHDPQLKERGFLVQLEDPELGVFGHPTPAYKLQKTRADIRTSPRLGENTEYICTQLLGITEGEFKELFDDGVFA